MNYSILKVFDLSGINKYRYKKKSFSTQILIKNYFDYIFFFNSQNASC